MEADDSAFEVFVWTIVTVAYRHASLGPAMSYHIFKLYTDRIGCARQAAFAVGVIGLSLGK